MNVPYLVPKDEETPYPADFERVVSAVRSMGRVRSRRGRDLR